MLFLAGYACLIVFAIVLNKHSLDLIRLRAAQKKEWRP